MAQSVFLSIVLPAYNEAGSIGRALTAMRTFLDRQGYTYEVIAAIDGDDNTPEVVQEFARDWPALKLDAQRGRHGKGHGLRRGMALATGEIIGFMDADYKTPVDEVVKLLPYLERGYDLVVGSRGVAESRIRVKQPLYRRLGSRGFGLCMHALIGLHHIRDTQCGFKFFTREAARAIFSQTRIDGYMCDIEILWLAQVLGYRVQEVGIAWQDDHDSRLELFRGNAQNIIDLLRIRFHSYRPLAATATVRAAQPHAEAVAWTRPDTTADTPGKAE
jgi:dolichyl-phosphate beta-glucosyltransferase